MSGCARPERALTTTCRSPAGSSSPWSACGFNSRTRRWPHCTGCTGPPSRARSGRCGRCWPPAGLPCTVSPGCGCAPWPACLPARGLAAWNCGSTAPKCRSGARARGSRAAARSCRARKSRTRRRPQSSPARTAAPCGRARSARGGRPDRGADRGHRRPVPPVPPGQSQSRCRVPRPGQGIPGPEVLAPPLKPKKDAAPGETAACEAERHQQSSERICVEHASAEHKQWRVLQRYPGRREEFDETYLAVAGLVSDRAAER